MARLRGPGGCPWDAEQTHASLRPYVIEEAHEVCDAIDRGDDRDLVEELGDLLLQVVFHAELGAERSAFSIGEVVDHLVTKLVRRHPHVFGEENASTTKEVVANWARIKATERRERARTDDSRANGALAGVPRSLPALLRAHRLGEKAGAVGFDWPDASAVRQKVDEETAEIDSASTVDDLDGVAAEIGDLLFTLASYARHLGLKAEVLLHAALDRFEERFALMEADLGSGESSVEATSPTRLDEAWHRAKSSARKLNEQS